MKNLILLATAGNFCKLILFALSIGFISLSCRSTKNMIFVNNSESGIIEGNYVNQKNGNNIIRRLDRKLLKDTIDTKINYEQFEISFEKKKRITFKISDSIGNVIVRDYKFKNKKGIYYLKNQNVKPLLIPFICGALNEKRLYLYKNKNGKLSINVYESSYGAIFLIGFIWGNQSSHTVEFTKIVKK